MNMNISIISLLAPSKSPVNPLIFLLQYKLKIYDVIIDDKVNIPEYKGFILSTNNNITAVITILIKN